MEQAEGSLLPVDSRPAPLSALYPAAQLLLLGLLLLHARSVSNAAARGSGGHPGRRPRSAAAAAAVAHAVAQHATQLQASVQRVLVSGAAALRRHTVGGPPPCRRAPAIAQPRARAYLSSPAQIAAGLLAAVFQLLTLLLRTRLTLRDPGEAATIAASVGVILCGIVLAPLLAPRLHARRRAEIGAATRALFFLLPNITSARAIVTQLEVRRVLAAAPACPLGGARCASRARQTPRRCPGPQAQPSGRWRGAIPDTWRVLQGWCGRGHGASLRAAAHP